MTQKEARKWYKEIERWAKAPDRTRVWNRFNDSTGKWAKAISVNWFEDLIYIVDDEWQELRRAQIDGKQLQRATDIGGVTEWIDQSLSLGESGRSDEWRIKPEENCPPTRFPAYFRDAKYGYIIKFVDHNKAVFSMSEEISDIGLESYIYNFQNLVPVKTVEIDGVTYYDTQPVWVWDEDDNILRSIAFVDAKNQCTFGTDLKRHGYEWEHYAPVKHIEPWMVESWQKLRV